MDFDDNLPEEATEIGSDELLSGDNLRLPESASILVRLHAVRAWLTRRQRETNIEIGTAALALQETMMQLSQNNRLRRREQSEHEAQQQYLQKRFLETQHQTHPYEEAEKLLEECVSHTSGERVLVEYYLTLDELMQSDTQVTSSELQPRILAFADVQRRVEHVGSSYEED